MTIRAALAPIVLGTLLAAVAEGPPGRAAKEIGDDLAAPACRPVEDLEPTVSAGAIENVPSPSAASGSLLRWSAAVGQTLRLRVRTEEPGAYEISIRAAGATDAVVALSAHVWQTPLTQAGAARIVLPGASPEGPPGVIRFDAVPLGPGYHRLELACLAAGDVVLDCVALRRTGDLVVAEIGGDAEAGDEADDGGDAAAEVEERAFLGIEIGPARDGGVTISRVLPDTAASVAGLEAGDVLLTIDEVATATAQDVRRTVASHHPGDMVEVVLLRGGERITRPAELRPRPATAELRADQAARVLEMLAARPGQTIADIGCGSGWLSEAIAAALGPEGTVYAVEIQERHVERLHGRTVPGLVPVLSVADDVCLPADSLDTAMLHDVASHVDRAARPRFYESVTRALKTGGRLVVFGPHGKADTMLRVLRQNGFIAEDHEALAALSPRDLDERLRDGIVFREE